MNSPTRRGSANLASACSRRAALARGGAAAAAAGLAALGLPRVAGAEALAGPAGTHCRVAFPPGGATDILARTVGQRLAGRLGQQVVVENKPGAGSIIGLEAAAKAAPDGYVVFLSALTNQAIAQHLYPKTRTTIGGDFVQVSLLANGAHILNVHPSVPAKTMAEFIAWLTANSGKVNYASQGTGTLSHLEAEMLQQRLGVQLVHVPYKGQLQCAARPDRGQRVVHVR